MSIEFSSFNLSEDILKALNKMNFKNPTVVQEQSIELVLNKKDLIVKSKTGSGKTAAFGIPILEQISKESKNPQVLILTPTRELAVQVDSDLKEIGQFTGLKFTPVYGQHNMDLEIKQLSSATQVVTGTPGRVFDHIQRGTLITKDIKFLVLDEADKMLDMGFIESVEAIIRKTPENRVTLLFSASMPFEIKNISSEYMKTPTIIEIASETETVDIITQYYHRVEHNEKRKQLDRVILSENPTACIVFANTRFQVDKINEFLQRKGYKSNALHGAISQSRRLKTINQFKTGEFNFLVATDVASRGIHVDNITHVINYDLPIEKDSYVHRIGRTGRAGKEGKAISLVTDEDIMSLYEIEEHINAMIEEKDLPTNKNVNLNRIESEKRLKANVTRKHNHRTEHTHKAKNHNHSSNHKFKYEKIVETNTTTKVITEDFNVIKEPRKKYVRPKEDMPKQSFLKKLISKLYW